jgi:hypothetical protein
VRFISRSVTLERDHRLLEFIDENGGAPGVLTAVAHYPVTGHIQRNDDVYFVLLFLF